MHIYKAVTPVISLYLSKTRCFTRLTIYYFKNLNNATKTISVLFKIQQSVNMYLPCPFWVSFVMPTCTVFKWPCRPYFEQCTKWHRCLWGVQYYIRFCYRLMEYGSQMIVHFLLSFETVMICGHPYLSTKTWVDMTFIFLFGIKTD